MGQRTGAEDTFRFEGEDALSGWTIDPPQTVHLDEVQPHSGQRSVRLERDASSAGTFTKIERFRPVDVVGRRVRLQGHLRTEEVSEHAGLWLRVDGERGCLAFDNMMQDPITGTHGWTAHQLELPLPRRATRLAFGALLVGTGRAWVDDLQLWVDGQPLGSAPTRGATVFETDTEFDAGSGITLEAPSQIQLDNLVLLCEVWGFLKHHHPRVTSGELHWDYELFRILPHVLQAPDAEGGQAALLALVERLGPVEACEPCAEAPARVHLTAPTAWISGAQRLSVELSGALLAIERSRPVLEEQAFVARAPAGNPDLSGELAYAGLTEPDAGYRILALFRLWNIVRYWFPYRDLIEEDWRGVLARSLPRLIGATSAEAYRLELNRFIGHLHDSHASLREAWALVPPRGSHALSAQLRFVDEQAIVWDAPADSALQIGDVLLSIDGETIEAMVTQNAPHYPASNRAAQLRDMARRLTRGPQGPVEVRVRRGREHHTLALERRPTEPRRGWHERPGDPLQWLGDEIAYLKPSSITADEIAGLLASIEGTRGLVIDLRSYPAWVIFELGGHLVDERTPFARFTRFDPVNPGVFVWTEHPMALEPIAPRYPGRIAILVDEVTQSRAEYTAMALSSAPQAVVVGSTTAGADGNYSEVWLPGGLHTGISGLGVFTPQLEQTQRVGIPIDVEIRPTIEGIAAGRDEVLEAALRTILGETADEETLAALARRPIVDPTPR